MMSNCGITLLFIIVVSTKFQHGHAVASNRTEVQCKFICTSKWQKLDLTWTFTVENSSLIQNVDSFWSEYGTEFKHETMKRLHHAVIYAHNFTNNFSCYGNLTSQGGPNGGVNFHVQLPKIGPELVGVRLIRLSFFHKRLEFYLRSPGTISQDEYSLHYCVDRDLAELFVRNACPKRKIIKFNCSWRENDVFGIPDSAGFICQALASRPYDYATYKFRIQLITKDNSISISNDFMLETRGTRDDGPVFQFANQGFFTVLPRARKLRYLITTSTLKQVILRWEDINFEFYRINYTCSNGLNSSLLHKETALVKINNDFAPYSQCEFCISSVYLKGELWSEPLCNITSFPEIPPSMPPRITCGSDTCPTITKEESQTVTVECEFPEESTRNGVLNKLVVNYWTNTNNELKTANTTNLSSCEVTLYGLSKNSIFYARMSVCNTKGCSGFSDDVKIAKNNPGSLRSSSKLQLLWILSLPILVIIALVIFLYNKYCKSTKQAEPLPEIQEQNNYNEIEGNKGQILNDYATLSEDSNDDSNGNSIDKTS